MMTSDRAILEVSLYLVMRCYDDYSAASFWKIIYACCGFIEDV